MSVSEVVSAPVKVTAGVTVELVTYPFAGVVITAAHVVSISKSTVSEAVLPAASEACATSV